MLNRKIISVLIFGAILAFLMGSFLIDRNITEEMKELFVYKTHTNKKYDIVVVGDSRVYRGITTNPLKNILDASALNLGYSAGSFSEDILNLAESKLDPDGKKILILGITAHGLTEDAAPDRHYKSINELKKEEVLDFLYLAPLKRKFKSTTPEKLYSNLFKKNSKQNNYVQEPYVSEGWVASDYIKRAQSSSVPAYIKRLQKTNLSQNMINSLFEKTREWVEKGYHVYYFYPPSSFNNEQAEDLILNFDRHKFCKKSTESQAKWISLDSSYVSYDGSHLVKESAITLSNEIANKINNKQFYNYKAQNINSKIYKPNSEKIFSYHKLIEDKKHEILNYKEDHIEYEIISTRKSFLNYRCKFDKKLKPTKKILIEYEAKIFNNKRFDIVYELRNDKDSVLIWKGEAVSPLMIANQWNKLNYNINIPDSLRNQNLKFSTYFMNKNRARIQFKDYKIHFYN